MSETFVGRQDELREISTRLASSPVVTLLGLGGVGKTRLAREVGRRREAATVLFCDLSAAHNTEDICSAVAAVLGVGLAIAGDPAARIDGVGRSLAARSREGETLLVLDDAEGAAADLAPLLDRWTQLAPNAKAVVTSRVRIGCRAEYVVPIEPLPTSAAAGTVSDAETLFTDRARAIGANLTEADRPKIRELVTALEGIPLAIELIAARARLLPVDALVARVTSGQDVGSVAGRTERRHATMRHVVEGSWELLGPEARSALLACSCFHGGFSMESAEAMLGPGALELLQALVDASLLRTIRGPGGEARFDMFETVRAFAAAELHEHPEQETALVRRHAEMMARAARTWRKAASATGGAQHLAALGREHDNLAYALTRLVEQPSLDAEGARIALTLAVELEPIRMIRGHAATYVKWLRAALATIPEGKVTGPLRTLRLRATLAEGRALSELGQVAEAREAFARARQIAIEEEDPVSAGWAACGVARIDAHSGSWKKAVDLFSEAKMIATRARDEALLQETLASASFYGSELSDSEEQLIPIEQATDYFRRSGDERVSLRWLVQLGRAYTDFDRLERAETRLQDGLQRARAIGDRGAEGFAQFGLGSLFASRDKLEEAANAYREGAAILEEVGEGRHRGYALGYLGVVEQMRGRYDEAATAYEAGCTVLSAAGDEPNAALFSLFRASLEADRDRVEEAAARFAPAHVNADAWIGNGMRPLVAGILGAVLAAARARTAHAKNDLEEVERHRREAREHLKLATTKPESIVSSRDRYDWRDVSFDARIAARLAQRSVDTIRLPEKCVVITHDCARIQLRSDAAPIDLSSRRVLRQVLSRLVEARLAEPAKAVPGAELIAAGWPGEHMAPRSSANRLHVTLGMLRRLGLEDFIETVPGGWRLRPDVPLLRVEK